MMILESKATILIAKITRLSTILLCNMHQVSLLHFLMNISHILAHNCTNRCVLDCQVFMAEGNCNLDDRYFKPDNGRGCTETFNRNLYTLCI